MPRKCMDFLSAKRKGEVPPAIVVFGDEPFLHRQAVQAVRRWVLGDDGDDGFTFSSYDGASVALAVVLDDLSTPPFLGEIRLVLVENADPFVSNFRKPIERFVQKPTDCGVLLLDVSTWPSNTNLYKLVEQGGLAIDCAAPKAYTVPSWCTAWASQRYGKTLEKPAAEHLVDLVGTSLGQLDQELSKLSTYVADRPQIDIDAIDHIVAGTRTETVFKLFDMVLEGQIGKALEQLDRLFLAGESPVGILAMVAAQLRKLARAARDTEFGLSTADALIHAGVPPFAIERARQQLNHFGRERMNGMYRRLLRADLDLKGDSGLSQRAIVERLLIELARPKKVSGSAV